MFEELKIERDPHCVDRVRVRFHLDPRQVEKLRPLVMNFWETPEFDLTVAGSLLTDHDVTVFYGVDEWGDGGHEDLFVSLTYQTGDEDDFDYTREIELDKAWPLFVKPLAAIKRALI